MNRHLRILRLSGKLESGRRRSIWTLKDDAGFIMHNGRCWFAAMEHMSCSAETRLSYEQ